MATKASNPALPKIYSVRRLKVVLDEDLARLYGVPTKQLNQAVRRNADRFPEDFCFFVSDDEAEILRSQSVTLKPDALPPSNLKSQSVTSSLGQAEAAILRSQSATLKPGLQRDPNLRSQFATSSLGHGGRRKLPRVFTEHGALMAANILRSQQAVQMSLYLVRAFVALREQLASNLSVLRRIAEIDKKLIEHDVVLSEVMKRLQPLLNPPPEEKKPKIGFHHGPR